MYRVNAKQNMIINLCAVVMSTEFVVKLAYFSSSSTSDGLASFYFVHQSRFFSYIWREAGANSGPCARHYYGQT